MSALVVLLTIGLFLALAVRAVDRSVVFLPLVTGDHLTIVLSPVADKLGQLGLPNCHRARSSRSRCCSR
jgi:hypothetical protein